MNAVEVFAGQPFLAGEVDRVEPADHDRIGRTLRLVVEFAETVEERVVGPDPWGHAPIDAVTVEPADVGEQGKGSFEAMAVRFDHPRRQHVVGEASVDLVGSPAGALLE